MKGIGSDGKMIKVQKKKILPKILLKLLLNGARDELPIQCNDGDCRMYSLKCKQSTKLRNGIDERH